MQPKCPDGNVSNYMFNNYQMSRNLSQKITDAQSTKYRQLATKFNNFEH